MTTLQVKVRPALEYFYWTDVSDALEKEMGCKWEDFHHTFMEWMEKYDPEAGSGDIGTTHNIDEQIAELQKKITQAATDGEFDDIPEDELDDFIADEYYGMAFLKALKNVLGEYSTKASFLYSW